MREILFRGKRVELVHGKIVFGDWVYGYYYDNACQSLLINGKDINAEYILVKDRYGDVACLGNLGSPSFFQVLPETVGQYTGLTDNNDNMIFEGDIVKVRITQTEDKKTYEDCKYKIGVIVYNENFALFTCKNNFMNFINWAFNDYEVIGNIHDNPELLEVE